MTADRMTVEGLLREGAARLRAASIETARLDARILLGRVLGREASGILPGDDSPVDETAGSEFRELIERRAAREPVGRILGEREFYGRPFRLSPATLEPRPDSEATVELALDALGPAGRVLDIGTGTGCLLLTLLAERPGTSGLGVDISDEALATAGENARRFGLADRAVFRCGNWLEGLDGPFDLVISNPPYIPDGNIPRLMPEVRDHDPHAALAGGPDGLDAYRAIFAGAVRILRPGGPLVLEIGEGQAADIAAAAAAHGLHCSARRKDLGGHVRALLFHTEP